MKNKERIKEKLIELCNDVRMNCGREADISKEEIEELVDDYMIELDSLFKDNQFNNSNNDEEYNFGPGS